MTDKSKPENKRGSDEEQNRFSARAARYARVGANVGGVAARYAGRRLLAANRIAPATPAPVRRARPAQRPADEGRAIDGDHSRPVAAGICRRIAEAAERSAADGLGFRQAPHDGGTGAGWEKKFESFEHHPSAAASLGQVHRALSLDGAALACKLQYPDMQSAVEADLQQLQWLLAIRRRFDSAIDTTEIGKEIGARVREELDYCREAKHVALYREMLDGVGWCACRAPGRNFRPDVC